MEVCFCFVFGGGADGGGRGGQGGGGGEGGFGPGDGRFAEGVGAGVGLDRLFIAAVGSGCGMASRGTPTGFRGHHPPEPLQCRQAVRDAIEGIHQRNQLRPPQRRVLAILVLVVLEEYFQRGPVPDRLQLAPQPALVAPDAVHQPAYVAEPVAEVLFQVPDRGVGEHERFVEDETPGRGAVGQCQHFALGGEVLERVAGAEGVVLQISTEFGDGAQDEGVVEVEIGDAVRVGGQALGVAVQVGAPGAGCLVQVVVADVGGDGGVHAADDAVEDAFFEALVVERDFAFGGSGEHDAAEIVGCLKLAGAAGGGCGARETVLPVYGVPDHVGSFSRVAGEPFGVVH